MITCVENINTVENDYNDTGCSDISGFMTLK